MEVFKSVLSMITACFFIWCAATFVAAAIERRSEKWWNLAVAGIIELVSMTIFVPNLNTIFEALEMTQQSSNIAMIISILIIFVVTLIIAAVELKRQKT